MGTETTAVTVIRIFHNAYSLM